MRIYGIDFTSRPKRRKPITCLEATLDGTTLRAGALQEWQEFSGFEEVLRRPGPWIAGIDFPFGQSRTFIGNIAWPATWPGYVAHAKSLGREGFRETLSRYRESRPAGDRKHRRKADSAAGSISPQKLYGVPVGLMFFEGRQCVYVIGAGFSGRRGKFQSLSFNHLPGRRLPVLHNTA
jgi:hypothetical protein